MKKIFYISLIIFSPLVVQAEEAARFLGKLQLPSGQTVVVAEGDFEARSAGSFSVRLYDAAEPEDATTFFSSGLVQSRDGTVEKIELQDINGDKQPEIVVNIRSAGSGGYLSAYAFSVSAKGLALKSSVEGLEAKADTVAALKKALKK